MARKRTAAGGRSALARAVERLRVIRDGYARIVERAEGGVPAEELARHGPQVKAWGAEITAYVRQIGELTELSTELEALTDRLEAATATGDEHETGGTT